MRPNVIHSEQSTQIRKGLFPIVFYLISRRYNFTQGWKHDGFSLLISIVLYIYCVYGKITTAIICILFYIQNNKVKQTLIMQSKCSVTHIVTQVQIIDYFIHSIFQTSCHFPFIFSLCLRVLLSFAAVLSTLFIHFIDVFIDVYTFYRFYTIDILAWLTCSVMQCG